MSQPNDADRSTPVLVEASDIMRTLSLPRLTTLHYIDSHDIYTQQEVADVIGCSRSSVSQYLQSMTSLPVALVEKRGQHHRITEAGNIVLSHLNGMLKRLDVPLETISSTDERNTEEIGACLSPFDNARSSAPFLLLYSIGIRGALGDRIDLLTESRPVAREDILLDVKARQEERGETITRKRVQHLLRRFDEAHTIEQEVHDIMLTEKGHEQANLLERLIQLVENQTETDSETDSEMDTGVQSTSHGREVQMDTIAQQDDPRGFLDDAQSTAQATAQDRPDIVPIYCLRSTQADSVAADTQSELLPLLPLTSLTLNELATHVGQLMSEYDGNVEVEPYWALRTETDLYPLAPAHFPLAEASHQAWQIVNDAHGVWEEQSR